MIKKGYLINFRGVNGQSSRKHVFKKQQALYEKYTEANEFGELCTLQMSKYLISSLDTSKWQILCRNALEKKNSSEAILVKAFFWKGFIRH